MKGIYILILKLDYDVDIQIGKLGNIRFLKGYYAYVGSAQGAGGFKRVTRHLKVASGMNSIRKWHIDYLLPHSRSVYAVLLPTCDDLECAIAKKLAQFLTRISGFGCTDCSCPTHLFHSEKDPEKEIVDACKGLAESIIISTRN